MENKITEDYLKSIIKDEEYWNNGKTTICILKLKNGFEINGSSSLVDPSNFDESIGRKIAYDNAFEQLWLIEGYRLQCELFGNND